MNVLRLVFGWLFLAALTAAGTFYAMDEVDQRVGLAKFHLHEKFGMIRYASVPAPKPGPGPTPVPTPGPTPVPTPTPTPGPDPLRPPVSVDPTPGPTPGPGPALVVPTPTPTPSPVVPTPTPGPDPARRTHVTPDPYRPPTPTPTPPSPRDGMSSTPASKPRDFDEVNERLIDVKSRAEAARNSWASIERSLRSMNQPLRPEISAALSSMRRYTQQAEQALNSGDTAAARRYLDQAEKQMDLLRQYRE